MKVLLNQHILLNDKASPIPLPSDTELIFPSRTSQLRIQVSNNRPQKILKRPSISQPSLPKLSLLDEQTPEEPCKEAHYKEPQFEPQAREGLQDELSERDRSRDNSDINRSQVLHSLAEGCRLLREGNPLQQSRGILQAVGASAGGEGGPIHTHRSFALKWLL